MSDPVYTPNSHKYREEQKTAASTSTPAPDEKRVQKVVKNPARTKKNEVRKLADIFISEDISNVKSYIFMDVLVPAIKKAIYDKLEVKLNRVCGEWGIYLDGHTSLKFESSDSRKASMACGTEPWQLTSERYPGRISSSVKSRG